MPQKTLLNAKLELIKKVRQSKNFKTKASMNSFIDKIAKTNTFSRVQNYNDILENINKSSNKFTISKLNTIKQEIKSNEVKLAETTTIKILKDDDDYMKIINRTLVDNAKKGLLSRCSINFPGQPDLNDVRTPDQLKIKQIGKMNFVMFWFFYQSSDVLKTTYYFGQKKNYNKVVTVKIQTFNKVQGVSDAEHYRRIQSFATPETQKIEQTKREDLKCVPQAIIKYFERKLVKGCNSDYKNRYNNIIKKMSLSHYNKRYTIDELRELSTDLNITFIIRDLINNDITVKGEGVMKYQIILFNICKDHVELYPEEQKTITQELSNNIINNNDFYYKLGNKIVTKDIEYTIDDNGFGEIYKKFKETNKINLNYIESDSKESQYISNYYHGMHQLFNFPTFTEKEKKLVHEQDIIKLNNLYLQYDNLDDKINEVYKNTPPTYDVTYNIQKINGFELFEDEQIINETIPQQLNILYKQQEELRNKIEKQEAKIKDNITINNDDYKEYDLKNAYYNLTNNAEYGVPSNALLYYENEYSQKIEQHIKENKSGYYHIQLKNKIDKIFPDLEHVLTTPQVMTLKKHNINFKIISCLIAPQIKLRFDKDTLKEVPSIKAYCKIVGIMTKQQMTNEITIYTKDAPSYYKQLKLNENDTASINYSTIHIYQNKNITLKHIGSFIHSYVSSKVLDFIFTNGSSNVLGVKLDSIIVKKDFQAIHDDNFRVKSANIEIMSKEGTSFFKPLFESLKISYNNTSLKLNDKIIYSNFILLSGKGGSGKTESIAKHNMITSKHIIYGALAWERGADFRNKYGNDYITSSIPKLLSYGENNVNIKDQIKCKNTTKFIILDEPTLISEEEIIKIKNKWSDKIIILVGDIDEDGFYYQCSLNATKDNFKVINPRDHSDIQIIKYTTNYRFDGTLNDKLDNLRHQMRMIKNNIIDEKQQNEELKKYVLKEFNQNIVTKKSMKISSIDDLGISAHDEEKLNFKYSNYFTKNGSIPIYYQNKTDINRNLYKGARSTQKTNNNQIIKLFSTVHSTQGKTCEGKLIIIIESSFDFNLYYTALSRSRSIKQINIINNWN